MWNSSGLLALLASLGMTLGMTLGSESSSASVSSQSGDAGAETARWMVANGKWGYVTSLDDENKPSAAVLSFSDGAAVMTGRPFFYIMGAYASYKASLTISQAAFNHTTSCEAVKLDPEDPRCAKLTLSGTLQVASGEAETLGKSALFARHPQMKTWPASHQFTVYELKVEDIWLLDYFGGGAPITPEKYYAAKPKHNVPSWPPAAAIPHAERPRMLQGLR
jgi:hypothetical protein